MNNTEGEQVVNEVVQNEEQTEVVLDPKIEQEARQFGWVPKEDFKGPEDSWRNAETFLERGREINGYLRKDMDKLKHSINSKDREIEELKETMQEFKKFHEQTEKRAKEAALAELKLQKKEALESGEVDRIVEIDDQILEIKAAQKQTVEKKPDVVSNK